MFLENVDHVLVPLDLSDASRVALREAVAIARSRDAKLTVLTVVDTSFPYPDMFSFARPDDDYFRTMKETVEAKVRDWLADAGGVSVDVAVIRGKARVEIPAFAADCGAKLIVVTTHGQSGVRGALLGSTTEAVVRLAKVPVLVLPLGGLDHDSPLPFA